MGRSTGCNCRCEDGCNESVIKFTEINPHESYSPNEDIRQEVTPTGYLYKLTKPFPSSYFTFGIYPPLLKHQNKFSYNIFIREGSHDGPIKFKLTFDPHRLGDYSLPEYVSDYGTYEVLNISNPIFTDWTEVGFEQFFIPQMDIPDGFQNRSSRLEISNEEYLYSLYRIYNPALVRTEYNSIFPSAIQSMQAFTFFFQVTVRDSGILIHDITTNAHNRVWNDLSFEGYQKRPFQNVLIDDINNLTRSGNKIFNYTPRGIIGFYSPMEVEPSGYYIKYNNSGSKMYVSYSIDFSDGEELDVIESELYNFWTVERSNIYNEIDNKNNDCVFPVIYGSNKYNYMTPLWEFVNIFDHRDLDYYEYHGLDHYYGGGAVQAHDNSLHRSMGVRHLEKTGIVNVNYERIPSEHIFPSYKFVSGSIKKQDESRFIIPNMVTKIGVTHINQDEDNIILYFEGQLTLNILESIHTETIETHYYHTINRLENDFRIGIRDIIQGPQWGDGWRGKFGERLNFIPTYRPYSFTLRFDATVPRWSGKPPEINITYSDIINGDVRYGTMSFGDLEGKEVLNSLNGSQLINSCYIDTMDFITYTDEQWGTLAYKVDIKLGYNISTFNTEDLGFKLVPINTSMRHPDV